MTPSPEQIAKWREELEVACDEATPLDIFGNYIYYKHDLLFRGYVLASTKQATEIAALKAQIAELMPLAKFGAMVIDGRVLMFQPFNITSDALKAGVLISDGGCPIQAITYAPNIEAIITKLLKD
jgi:hypothetical protein